MKILHQKINPVAIFLCAVAAFAVGFVWYSYLFSAQWIAGHNFTPEQMSLMGNSSPLLAMIGSFIGYLITATVLSVILSYARITDLTDALCITALLWFGFSGVMAFTGSLYAGGAMSVYLIDAGYQLVYCLIMAAIINRMS